MTLDERKPISTGVIQNLILENRGKLKSLLDLALENAKENLDKEMELIEQDDKKRREASITLAHLVNIPKVERIESFDNSHLFGTYYVGGVVVFNNFLPNKNEYRKYKIDASVKDDLGAMREVLYRRYYKVLMENLEKPDLIVLDGGKNQI